MEGRRYVVVFKLRDTETWVESLRFFSRENAEVYAVALRNCFAEVEDCAVVEVKSTQREIN
jgi:hypothetical protein